MAQITVIADEGACTTHDPAYENILGGKESYREAPRRLSDLLTLFRSHPEVYRVLDAYDYGIQPLLACHDGDYLDFLRGCYHQWVATGGSKDGVVSRIAYHPHFAQLSQDHPPIPSELSLDGRIGLYSWDLGHTITKDTFGATYAAAQVAVTAVDWLKEAKKSESAPFVFAATRPPGHHAGSACTGGYCYINNAAIAARRLQAGDTSTRIAIVDLDAHFGNGTADIFAADPSVLYVSLHADKTFPHFGGQAEQDGIGAGKGYTRNYPLPVGTSQKDYLDTLDRAVKHVEDFQPAYLVVSLGVDAITEEGYGLLGQRVARLGLPSCIVMEGGYNLDDLPKLFHAFLSGFSLARRDS